MSLPPPAPAAAPRFRNLQAWLFLAVIAYGSCHLLWYWQTPLGRSPVLDERENLDLARQIAEGRLAAEPFYRSLVYPLILAPLFALDLPEAWIPLAATGLGLLIHLANTGLVAALARRWFGMPAASALALVLHGLNPVLIHYATQVLDAALANTFLLVGLWALTRACDAERHARWLITASVAWAVAGLTRPQLLPVWFVFGGLAAAVRWPGRDLRRWRAIAAAVLVGAGVLAVQGLIQRQISGQFRILPTQGPYNLWAANRPGANGRYFTQSIYLASATSQQNPTRIESLLLYQRETGDTRDDLDAANAYWSRRLWQAVREQPLEIVRVQLRKLYYLLNDQEQYNNKTYAFHQARSPALRFNPLGWGIVSVLGALGAALVLSQRPTRALGVTVMILLLAVAAGIMTGYVSARFRLPLAAVFCGLAGGAMRLPALVRTLSVRRRVVLGTALVLLTALTYSRFGDVGDRSTFLQDHLLVAAAAERTGDDAICWNEAGAALQLAPGRPDALALRVTSYFNLLLQGATPAPEPQWWQAARQYLEAASATRVPAVDVLAAFASWRSGADTAAIAELRRLALAGSPAADDALGALVLLGAATPNERDRLLARPAGRGGVLALLGRTQAAPAPAPDELRAATQRLLARPAP